ELQVKSGNKRDPRSDLTQLCGLLFFALTAEPPVTLLDDQSRLPHQRPHVAKAFAPLQPGLRSRLNRFFDVGFAVAIDRRFQSAEALREGLLLLMQPEPQGQPDSTDAKLDSLLQRLSAAPFVKEKEAYLSLFNAVERTLINAHEAVTEKMGGKVGRK